MARLEISEVAFFSGNIPLTPIELAGGGGRKVEKRLAFMLFWHSVNSCAGGPPFEPCGNYTILIDLVTYL
jgi:hypothetical protein